MTEHAALVIAVIGWFCTYWFYSALEETFADFQRRERVREMRDANESYIACDQAIRRLRAEIEAMKRERDEANTRLAVWRNAWKERNPADAGSPMSRQELANLARRAGF